MFVEQLIKKKKECIIQGFLEEGGVFLSLAGCSPSLLSFFLYPRKPQVSILQNSPPLSRLFTFKYFNNYFPKKEKQPNMKYSSFDLNELICQNKNLDVCLDALGYNLDLFLHKTYLLTEFICHLRKIISLSYELICCYNLIG